MTLGSTTSGTDQSTMEKGPTIGENHTIVEEGVLLEEEIEQGTKRGLTPRHVSLIIIGSSIGTGLFIGVGSSLNKAGSLSLFIAFVFYAVFVMWILMQVVAEMCSWLPIKGSVFHFANRFVDPALGFAAGWIYLYAATMLVCTEWVATAGVISFWTDANSGIFIAVSLLVSYALNIFAVKYYGETEFVSSMFKVLLIVGLMFFSFISMLGGNPNHDRYGFTNWSEGGLFREYLVDGSTGKFLAFWSVMIYAAFACTGPDVLMMIAGEVVRPRKTIPSAGKKSYIRIYLFYLGGIFFMNTLCAANNKDLVAAYESGNSGAAASPWVIGIRSVGVTGLDSLVNALIMTSSWSCGNAYLYTASRTLYSLSLCGYAPKCFNKCLKNGVPIYCVTAIALTSLISLLSISENTAKVFNWFVNLATTGFLCTYVVIFLVYFKFRKAIVAQGFGFESMYYITPYNLQPWASYFGFLMVCLILFFNGFWVFFPGKFTVSDLFTAYFSPVFFIVIYVGYKFIKKTKSRSDLEADITTDKDFIDREEEAEALEHAPIQNEKWKKVYDFFF